MTTTRTIALLISLLFLGACSGEAGATGKDVAGVTASITKVLTGITDGKTATDAKSQLETLTGQFGTAVASLKSMTGAAGGDAKSAIGDMAKKAVSALTPELTKSLSGVTEQITRLMGNADVTKAIGPVLEKLKGLIPTGG